MTPVEALDVLAQAVSLGQRIAVAPEPNLWTEADAALSVVREAIEGYEHLAIGERDRLREQVRQATESLFDALLARAGELGKETA